METLILYRSKHHGNTKKLIDNLPKREKYAIHSFEDADIPEAERIVLATGVYAFDLDPALYAYVEKEDVRGKSFFLVYTSASDGRNYAEKLKAAIEKKGGRVEGVFHCPGFCTFGPFRLFKGIRKGRPDEQDSVVLQKALDEKGF